ncbi:NEL-type E3 ubiquitin ligase domain-containing protein [Pseudomonas sp. GD03862]|uniref:NEL-type E3 ubiquitin ligase domain-containing protein n=1 Tax=Pseudomonas sp. GD03862 TaxID=2975391 RepID=UPI00244A799F|nr:NEL-type E3 ubiquitin ligase domain-containing protein [Pseudomonas sp. GD03862]MDH0706116.1 NEL-type E3 ubiquitin ligase domain-containing protein [Pseudomonas sp. GD03862]
MQNNSSQPSAAVDTLAMAQACQDHYIAQRLPAWMKRLSMAEFTLLSEALPELLACRAGLSSVLARLGNLNAFARPLLQQALGAHGDLDVDRLYFRQWYTFPSHTIHYVTSRFPVVGSDYYDIPLLEAALCNFTADQQRDQAQGNCLVDVRGARRSELSAPGFARLCRALDLGQKYQAHLDSVLQPEVRGLLTRRQRYSMLVDALQARAQGILSADELQWVVALCTKDTLDKLEGASVRVRQLAVFGCRLQQIVVLDVIDAGLLFNTSKRVLVYVPGDPHGPWSVRSDLEDYARRVLGKRLRKDDYRRFFNRFVRRRDSQRFFSAVSERLDDVPGWATRDLDEQTFAYRLPLFEHLADDWVARIKDDAAIIAPPVALLDREVQAEHARRLRAEGWTLLGVAGFFVPGIGAVLLGVMAWELLEQTFQSVGDWQENERNAALAHLLNVGKGLLAVGATVAVVATARRAWSVVDNLVPAQLENGEEKLWNADLGPYRCESPPDTAVPDMEGVHRVGERRWISMDGHWYEMTWHNDDEQWQLLPYQGYAPPLRHNGGGAWRLWCEQPAEWGDTRQLFRRLGGPFSDLDDAQIDRSLAIHGLDDQHLRAWHVYGRPPEAALLDTVTRVRLAGRIGTLVNQLREGGVTADPQLLERVMRLPQAAGKEGAALADVAWAGRRELLQALYEEQNPDTETGRLLRQNFASLHRLAANEVLRDASEDDLQFLRETGRVPLLMAEAARLQVARIRMARVYEALCIDTPQNLDLARVVLNLLVHVPGAGGPGWRLYDGDASEPLLTVEGSAQTFDLLHRHGLFRLRAPTHTVAGERGELFETLAAAYDDASQAAIGQGQPFVPALRQALTNVAFDQRQTVVNLLRLEQPSGSFLAPQRLADGRIGYPMAGGRLWGALGRNRPRALQARLRDLYPAFTDEQIGRWLASSDAQARLSVLEQQYGVLKRHLTQWARSALLSPELAARREFRKGLINCWRCLVPELQGQAALDDGRFMLTQTISRLRHLPALPAQVGFPHVSILALRAMRVEHVPDEFLRAFPNLRNLEITHCRLTRLPLPLMLVQKLEVLDLSGNQITLDQGQALVLADCRSLVYLNLSDNPLRRAFSVQAMTELNALYLSNTQMPGFPYGLMDAPELHTLNLSDNRISELPEGFHQSQLWRSGRVELSGNPLEAAYDGVSIWHLLEASRVPYRLRFLDALPGERRDEMAALWAHVESEEQSEEFFNTLSMLTESGAFNRSSTASALAARVFDMLQAMSEHDALRHELFEHAAATGCQDNATARFADLELRLMIWRTRHGESARRPELALLRLGAGMWRLALLDQLAAEHAYRVGAGAESIEFALAYRIALRNVLDLPAQPGEMLYAGIPALSHQDLLLVRERVLMKQTREDIAHYLSRQWFWQDYLHKTFPVRLQVPPSMHAELERLMALGNREEDIARLQTSNQQREHAVLLQLTLEALARNTVQRPLS